MKRFAYSLLVIAALTSIIFVQTLKPTSLMENMIISGWLMLPYIVLVLFLRFIAKNRPVIMATVIVSAIVVTSGLVFLIDIIYLHPDAQGGIAVMFTPIYQGAGMVVLFPAVYWLIRVNDKQITG